jgi:hypothetical protein
MHKPTIFVKSVETWTVKNPQTDPKVTSDKVQKVKIVVRARNGQFHGATNFKTKA